MILLVAIAANYAGLTRQSVAQWRPTGGLLDVTMTNQSAMTGGEVASARPDGIFYCPSRAAAVDAQVADASHFYFVQAYGSLAIHITSKKLADCWAAHALATTPNGPHYVKQWISTGGSTGHRTRSTAHANSGSRTYAAVVLAGRRPERGRPPWRGMHRRRMTQAGPLKPPGR